MKALLLLSGGIDSPVAGFLMKKKGLDLLPVYFDNYPFSLEETKQRALDNAKKLDFEEVLVVPHGGTLAEFMRSCNRKYQCVFCRRMMLRVAECLAEKHGAKALVTGENLAQVASQTLHNLLAEFKAVRIPIIRPLIGFDKEEIIRIAKKIGTYEISTRPVPCCTAVPRKPATTATEEALLGEEEKISVEELVEKEVEGSRIVRL